MRGILLTWGLIVAGLLASSVRAVDDTATSAAVAAFTKLGGKIDKNAEGRIVGLNLANQQVSDANLAHLAALPDLEKLVLWGADITDAGIEHLAPLSLIWQSCSHNPLSFVSPLSSAKPESVTPGQRSFSRSRLVRLARWTMPSSDTSAQPRRSSTRSLESGFKRTRPLLEKLL